MNPKSRREHYAHPTTLPEMDMTSEIPEPILREIADLSELSDPDFTRIMRSIMRAIMFKIRGTEGKVISAYTPVMHLLPDPYDRDRKNPLAVLPGVGCSYAESTGGCSMCNYATEGRIPTAEDIDQVFETITAYNDQYPPDGRAVFNINAVASIFSESEISAEIRSYLFAKVREYKDRNPDKQVVFVTEARYDHVTPDLLHEMRTSLGDNIIIELGLGVESTDDVTREAIINKGLPSDWRETMQLIKGYKMEVALHVIYGSPVLNTQERINDTIKSVTDCLEAGADTALIMVMNLKPGTLPHYLSKNHGYELPSVNELAELIIQMGTNLTPDQLRRTLIFGLQGPQEHQEAGVTYVTPSDDNEVAIYDVLLGWRGTQEELEAIKTLVGKYTPIQQSNTDIDIKERIAALLYRLSNSLYPNLTSDDDLYFETVADTFSQLDPYAS